MNNVARRSVTAVPIQERTRVYIPTKRTQATTHCLMTKGDIAQVWRVNTRSPEKSAPGPGSSWVCRRYRAH